MGRPQTIAFTAALGVLILGSWFGRFVGRELIPPLDLVLYFYPIYEATAGRLVTGSLDRKSVV